MSCTTFDAALEVVQAQAPDLPLPLLQSAMEKHALPAARAALGLPRTSMSVDAGFMGREDDEVLAQVLSRMDALADVSGGRLRNWVSNPPTAKERKREKKR